MAFVIEIKLDASKTKDGAVQAKTVARDIETEYRKAIETIKKYEKQIELLNKIPKLPKIPTDTGLKQAQAEIAKYQRQNLQAEKEITRAMEREAKSRSATQIRESKRASDAFIKSLNETESKAKTAQTSFSSILSGSFLGSFLGNIASQISSFIITQLQALPTYIFNISKAFADAGSDIYDASQKISLSAEALSTIKYNAEISGSSLQDFVAGYVKFEKALTSGNDKIGKTFNTLGIDIKQGIENPQKAFERFLTGFAKIPDGANRAKIATELFGKAGASLIPTFNSLGDNFQFAMDRARQLGLVMDGETAAQADALGDSIDTLGLIAKGVGYRFAQEFAPQLTSAFTDIGDAVLAASDIILEQLTLVSDNSEITSKDVIAAFGQIAVQIPAAMRAAMHATLALGAGFSTLIVGVVASIVKVVQETINLLNPINMVIDGINGIKKAYDENATLIPRLDVNLGGDELVKNAEISYKGFFDQLQKTREAVFDAYAAQDGFILQFNDNQRKSRLFIAESQSKQLVNEQKILALKKQGLAVDNAGVQKAGKKQKEIESIFSSQNQLKTTSGNRYYDQLYLRFAQQFGIDPNILLEQGRQETIGFKKSVMYGKLLSPKGAGGAGQFMPDTAKRFNVDITDPESSIRGQAEYMALLLRQFKGDYRLALAGYNAGEGKGKFASPNARLEYFLKNVAETRNYVPKIIGNAANALGYKNYSTKSKSDSFYNDSLKLTDAEKKLLDQKQQLQELINEANKYQEVLGGVFEVDVSKAPKQQIEDLTKAFDGYLKYIDEISKQKFDAQQRLAEAQATALNPDIDGNLVKFDLYVEQQIQGNALIAQAYGNSTKFIEEARKAIEDANKAEENNKFFANLKQDALSVIDSISSIANDLQSQVNSISEDASVFTGFFRQIGSLKELSLPDSFVTQAEKLFVSANNLDEQGFSNFVGDWLRFLADTGIFDETKIDDIVAKVRKAALSFKSLTQLNAEKLFNSAQKDLQNQLDDLLRNGQPLTVYEETLNKINNDYVNLNQTQKENLLTIASQIDAYRQYYEETGQYLDRIREIKKEMADKQTYNPLIADAIYYDGINQRISDINSSVANLKLGVVDSFLAPIDDVFAKIDEKIKNLPIGLKTLAETAMSFFKDIAKNETINFATGILDKFFPGLGSKMEKAKNPVVGELKDHTRLLQQIATNTGGLGIGGGTSFGGGGDFVSNLIRLATGGQFNAFGPNSNGQALGYPQATGTRHDGTFWQNQLNFGGSGDFFSKLKSIFSTKEGGIFAPKENVLTGQTSSMAGILGGIGGIASFAGGLIGGRVGGVLSSAGMGMQVGSMFGPWGAAIGAGVGALVGLFGGDPKKKQDKKENMPKLMQGFSDAFNQFTQLIQDTKNFKLDPDTAITRGRDLRTQIASGFGIQFGSKKYQKESQKLIQAKLLEIDRRNDLDPRTGGMMQQLEYWAERSRNAGERDRRMVAEFATGAFIDPKFMHQYGQFKRRNGYLTEGVRGRDTLPSLLMKNEMVINEMQARKIRRVAGFDVFAHGGIPNYPIQRGVGIHRFAEGGYIGSNLPTTANNVYSNPIAINFAPKIEIYLSAEISDAKVENVLIDSMKNPDVQVEVVSAYDKAKRRK